jgi:hypothetical protein
VKKEVALEVRKLDELSRRLKPLIIKRLRAQKYAMVMVEQAPPPAPRQDASAAARATVNQQAAGKEPHPEHGEARNPLSSWVRRWLRWS